MLWKDQYNEDHPDLNLWMNLRLEGFDIFDDVDLNKLCSRKESCLFEPEFTNFEEKIRMLLTTVVAVHKETRKVYLLAASWGFDGDRGDLMGKIWGGIMMSMESEERIP